MKDTINIGDTKEMLCEMLAIPSVSGDEGALSDYGAAFFMAGSVLRSSASSSTPGWVAT